MEQMRIDRGEQAMLARKRRERRCRDIAPLDYTTGSGPDVDEDLLARIDELLTEQDA